MVAPPRRGPQINRPKRRMPDRMFAAPPPPQTVAPPATAPGSQMFMPGQSRAGRFPWGDTALGLGIGLLTEKGLGEGVGQGLLYARQFAGDRSERERQAAQDQMQAERFGFEKQKYQSEAEAAAATKAEREALGASTGSFLDRMFDADPANDIPGMTPQAAMFLKGLPPEERAAQMMQYYPAPAAPKGASSGIGKIMEDLQAGLIDQATADALIRKETYIAPPGGDTSGVSLQPFYTTGPNGEIQMWQPTRSGQPIRVELPEGVVPSKPLSFQDLGTGIVGINPLGGQTQVVLPKDVVGEAAQKASGGVVGEAEGTAKAILPEAVAKADQAIALIDKLKNHPGKKLAVGGSSIIAGGLIPAIPGSNAADFLVALDQLKGKTFLEAYQSLKGGGAITVIEGTKGEQAIARLSTAQSEAEFDAALDELGEIVKAGTERIKAKAGGGLVSPGTQPSNIPPPPPGFQVVP